MAHAFGGQRKGKCLKRRTRGSSQQYPMHLAHLYLPNKWAADLLSAPERWLQ
jgi:hypothetical protein